MAYSANGKYIPNEALRDRVSWINNPMLYKSTDIPIEKMGENHIIFAFEKIKK